VVRAAPFALLAWGGALAVIGALACSACSRPPQPPVRRLAILNFDNQSGDPALDWIRSAAPSMAAAQLAGLAHVLPGRASSIGDAYLLRATTFVHGYFTARDGALTFVIDLEDPARHKIIQTIKVDGDLLSAANRIAHALDADAKPFTTSNAEAASAWGHGDYERAVSIDPDFSQAWLGWVQTLAASGNSARAIEIASQALARPLRGLLDRAQITLIMETLRKDDAARRTALAVLVQMMPADAGLTRAMAEVEMKSRRFPDAAGLYRTSLRTDPGDVAAMNALGYAEACAGNVEAARRALEEYGRQPGQQPNALDSLGEAYFMNGRFSEAEKYFLQAHARDPGLLKGGELLKAAYARWLRGDLPGADSIAQQYLQFRAGLHDPVLVWRQAVWLYSTGRSDQAIAKLKSAPSGEAELIEKQLALWRSETPRDLSALKEAYDRTSPAEDGQVRTAYAAALVSVSQKDAGQQDEARKLLLRWPLPGAGESLTESLMFPRFLALRRELNLK